MATINYQGKNFEISDDVAKALERDIENAKRKAVEMSAHNHLNGQMVFSIVGPENSDIVHRGGEQSEYMPIIIIHRAVVNEQRSVLWMPSLNLKLKDIAPLKQIYPVIDHLLLT